MTTPSPEVQILAPGFWRPDLGQIIDQPTPDDAGLIKLWQEYTGADDVLALQSIYGAYLKPKQPITAVASVDICEVLRRTGKAYHQIVGIEPNNQTNYTTGEWPKLNGYPEQYERDLMHTVLGLVMSRGMVEPVDGHREIADILRSWRQQGVYVAANTSTLSGCETGTIENTLARDYTDGFDAIVFPRNHDGTGHITKAFALGKLASETGLPITEVPVIHIDDTAHHVDSFHKWGNSDPDTAIDLRTFTPKYKDNGGIEGATYGETPLETFHIADQHLRDKGVIS